MRPYHGGLRSDRKHCTEIEMFHRILMMILRPRNVFFSSSQSTTTVLLAFLAAFFAIQDIYQKSVVLAEEAEHTTTSQDTEILLPEYRILDKERYDAPIKTQIRLEVLASGNITKESVRQLLVRLYHAARRESSFRHHGGHPTHIFIYVYPTEEHHVSGTGQWIGMLRRVGAGKKPELTINEEFLSQLGKPPVEKFGFTEKERKVVFRLLVDAETRADKKADEQYSLDKENHLRVGEVFQVIEETPFWTTKEPPFSLDARARGVTLPRGTSLRVTDIRTNRNGIKWYKVSLVGNIGKRITEGWTDSIALIGQFTVNDVKEQVRKWNELQDRLVKQNKKEIGRVLGLPDSELKEITSEAIEKHWPFYPPPKLVSPYRMWADNIGKHKQEAKFVSYEQDEVRLRHRDGRIVTLPMHRLSESDQDWIKNLDK